MEVTLIDSMGGDISVLNAARVSFSKESNYIRRPLNPEESLERGISPEEGSKLFKQDLSEKDQKLIKYLAKHKHYLPFRHPQLTFRIEAPIFVARQLVKHQVGMSWSEESRRYITKDVKFYTPTWREAAEDKKQGSLGEFSKGVQGELDYLYNTQMLASGELYDILLKRGVAPEQARMVLPQSMYTQWIWTGSLLSFSHVYLERTAPTAQLESQIIAQKIGSICKEFCPYSWEALVSKEESNG
jgi:thymidylate synthase (FAD)